MTQQLLDKYLDKKTIRISSFDIGKKNFAQYCEDINVNDLNKIKEEYNRYPKRLLGKVKNIPQELNYVMEMICKSGTRVITGVYDLRNDEQDKLDNQTRLNIVEHLNKYEEVWSNTDIFVLEQQYYNAFMQAKRKRADGCGANIDAIKIAEFVLAYFLIHYPDKEIISFNSSFKTEMLGAPPKLTKPQRKKWSEQKAHEIYTLRQDGPMMKLFDDAIKNKGKRGMTSHKLDDISDAMLQCQAFKYRYLIADL